MACRGPSASIPGIYLSFFCEPARALIPSRVYLVSFWPLLAVGEEREGWQPILDGKREW